MAVCDEKKHGYQTKVWGGAHFLTPTTMSILKIRDWNGQSDKRWHGKVTIFGTFCVCLLDHLKKSGVEWSGQQC